MWSAHGQGRLLDLICQQILPTPSIKHLDLGQSLQACCSHPAQQTCPHRATSSKLPQASNGLSAEQRALSMQHSHLIRHVPQLQTGRSMGEWSPVHAARPPEVQRPTDPHRRARC